MRTRSLIAFCLTVLAPQFAGAQALNYAQSTVEVKAGVVLIESQRDVSGPVNRSPHMWANLDKDITVKPAKWSFSNPLGQTSMTATMANRWAGRGPVPPVGSRLSKSAATYWEVSLKDASDKSLARFDVLSLTANGLVQLNTLERERLRKYVDQGGVLWMDLVNDARTPVLDIVNPIPFSVDWTVSNAAIDANLFHPLLRYPNAMTVSDLVNSEYGGQVALPVTNAVTAGQLGALDGLQSWIAADSVRLEPVAGNAQGETVSVGRIGNGFVVITARGVTATLNRGYDPSNGLPADNTAFTGMSPIRDTPMTAAAKLAVNIVSLGSQFTSVSNGSRKTNSTTVDLTAPLLRRFRDTQGDLVRPNVQPAMYKGRIVVTRGGRVWVYDAKPDRDVDANCNADDGAENTVGELGDVIWVSQNVAGTLSSAIIAEVPDVPNNGITNPNRNNLPVYEQVWATGSDGRLYCFDLNTDPDMNPQNPVLANWPPVATVNPPNGFLSAGDPISPTFHEGVLFVSDTGQDGNGRIWAADPSIGAVLRSPANGNEFLLSQTPRIPFASASPTVGYIPIQDSSGGVDRVLYHPAQPGTNVSPRPATISSIWIGSRGEVPFRRLLGGTNAAPVSMTLSLRAQYVGLPVYVSGGPDKLGVKVTMVKFDGSPFTLAEMQQYLAGPITASPNGEITLQMTGANPGGYDFDGTTGTPNLQVGWRVDYTVDWGQATTGFGGPRPENFVRGSIELQDDAAMNRAIVGNLALGPEGNIVALSSSPGNTGGSILNFKEDQGIGNFRLVSKYELYERLTLLVNDGTSPNDQITIRETMTDEDELTRQLPFLNGRINNLRFVGSPSIRGETLYVMVRGDKQLGFGPVPTGILLAMKASPGAPIFEMEGQDTNFTIVQPDPTISTVKTQPEQSSVLQQGNFVVEPIPNTTRSRITINNLMNINRGRMRDAISTSLPVIIRRPGQTDTPIEPEAITDNNGLVSGRAGGRFSPLLWYHVFNGFEPGSAPSVAGQTLFMGGSSALPALARGQFPPIDFDGLLFAFDANVAGSDEFLRPNSLRPWQLQLNTFLPNSNAPFDIRVSPSIKWPQFRGVQSFDDLRIRILQAAIEEDSVISMAAGDDSLACSGGQGLYSFSRSDFLVVDSGRVSRFDPTGNPIWNTDQTFQAGREGSVLPTGTGRLLSEPNRMYPAGENGFWIVDTGNDRIVRIDAAGREVRGIEKFKLDPVFRPNGVDIGAAEGQAAAESLSLKRPKDVIVFESQVAQANNPFSNPQPLERWVHLLIADSGNGRVVELVDRYALDVNTGRTTGVIEYADPDNAVSGRERALGILLWHSPEELSGKMFNYSGLARTTIQVGTQRRTVVAFGFGNREPGRATFGLDNSAQQVDRTSGNGGIVLYDGADNVVITEFERPAVPANAFLVETSPGVYDFTSPALPAERHKFVGLNAISLRYVDVNGGLQLAVMACDNTGVYELVEDLARPGTWVTRWMLPAQAYVGMRRPRQAPPYTALQLRNNPKGFRPMYARRLDSGEVLIVNGYTGVRFDNADFSGEVVLVDGGIDGTNNDPGYSLVRPNLGFNALSIKFELPPVQGVRQIQNPVFAERQ